MEKKVGILHVSDVHAKNEKKGELAELTRLMINDVQSLQEKYHTEVKAICITGDIINVGDHSEDELDLALSNFIIPLLEGLNLSEENVYIVPGNHEVQRSKIIPYVENGLLTTLDSEKAIDDFLNSDISEAVKRIQYFNDLFATQFGGNTVYQDTLCHTHILSLENMTLGFACVNSSWRSTGSGKSEKGRMVVGKRTILNCYKSINSADVKVCLMHHPLDWLVDDDRSSVEKCINSFDIVLNGHIHESDTKMWTSFNGQTLFNTCGKFDNSSDFYNGYTLLTIEPFCKDCEVLLRQYFGYPRNCFDEAIHLVESGVFPVSLNAKDDILALAYKTTHSIEDKFFEFANSFFISNIMSSKAGKGFDENFISPVFSKHSEYEKETSFDLDETDETVITVKTICESTNNILLLGRKEAGKTTILHYIVRTYISKFNYLKTVPLLVDCTHIDFSGKNPILRACTNFAFEYCDDGKSLSKNTVLSLLENGRCIVLFDNYDTVGSARLNIINEFVSQYSNNRFIFSVTETIGARSIRESPITLSCKHESVYICSLSKKQIRAIAKNALCQLKDGDDTSLVDKIMLCFKKTALPRTPFVLSLILSLCGDADFTPINEAVVMEQFMESILEKASPAEINTKVFDFRIKEDFLIYLVSLMHCNNKYFFTEDDFQKALYNYHDKHGFAVSETKFDRLFFDNGALIRTCGHITFRYTCMVEYYLAKKAKEDSEFLNSLLINRNYLNYPNEILYFTGLNRKDRLILSKLQEELQTLYQNLQPFLSILKEYSIGIDVAFPEEELNEAIHHSRFSQDQSDDISNSRDISERQLPETIDKNASHNEMDAFIQTLMIYGSCIKNLELIDLDEKRTSYKDYINGLNLMLAILMKFTQETFSESLKDCTGDNSTDETGSNHHIGNLVRDILMIALPLSVQNIAVENIGTAKLRTVIEEGINYAQADSFDSFFGVCTFCDLRLKGLKEVLQQYVKSIKNKSLLKIVFFKILYYYQFRYFSSSLDSFLENTLADINFKLAQSNKQSKSLYVKEIKNKRKRLFGLNSVNDASSW